MTAAESQRGANGRTVRAAAIGFGQADRSRGPAHGGAIGFSPAAEAAIGYAERLGWPLTPGYPVDGEPAAAAVRTAPATGAHPVPGAWRLAACADARRWCG